MVTLDQIRDRAGADLYPRQVLEGCETALVLFAAAFLGKQDAVWVADAGLTATCVDVDQKKLGEMVRVYPDDWEYVNMDVFEFASRASGRWDVVSLDCPTNLFDRCSQWLPVWCELAKSAVVLGCGERTEVVAPEGWALTDLRHRSSFRGGVYWAVLERQ